MKREFGADKTILFTLTVLLATTCLTHASEAETPNSSYSPYANQVFPQNLYWGDTHLHTNLSVDAYTGGNQILTPDDAYRFARGETITSVTGQQVKLSRPLDFLVVSDHAAFLGHMLLFANQDPQTKNSTLAERWADEKESFDFAKASQDFFMILFDKLELAPDKKLMTSQWQQVTAAAERYNVPGTFTAFIGYEWTSMPSVNNLHRNVIFRDGADKANQIIPFSAADSNNPEDLWKFLDKYEKDTEGKVLAIPHNGNISNGLMFSKLTYDGKPLTRNYAETRTRWEPIIEATQIKGDSETHPVISPEDKFADFEFWDFTGANGTPMDESTFKYSYARGALKLGLEFGESLGVNPYKFGMIGSTDSHTGMSAVGENNFLGTYSVDEPTPTRISEKTSMPGGRSLYSSSGYAAIWAEENTRDSLFDAMQRKEVYATTGSRMMVRFFGGWNFEKLDAVRPNYAAIGYHKGVPMGGDLSHAPAGKTPKFLVVASKDPLGANLDRVQIVKGWLDSHGQSQEKVYNIALSDNRKVDVDTGKAPAIESTVDVKTATYTNTVGDTELATVWEDPDFIPGERAFYYVRVLEIPTPRWTTYDAAFYGVDLPENFPSQIQERAYTSPIWYTP